MKTKELSFHPYRIEGRPYIDFLSIIKEKINRTRTKLFSFRPVIKKGRPHIDFISIGKEKVNKMDLS